MSSAVWAACSTAARLEGGSGAGPPAAGFAVCFAAAGLAAGLLAAGFFAAGVLSLRPVAIIALLESRL